MTLALGNERDCTAAARPALQCDRVSGEHRMSSPPVLTRLVLVCALLCFGSGALAGVISPGLEACLRAARPNEVVSAIAYLGAMPPTSSHQIPTLKDAARARQGPALRALSALPHKSARALWVVDAIAFSAPADTVREIARRRDIARVEEDTVHRIEPLTSGRARRGPGVPWNLSIIGADSLWAAGINGAGVRVGIIDTGVDASHPELTGKMAPGGWYDAVNGLDTAYDDNGHGTFVTGLICGGSAGGTPIGVAPGATYLAAKAINSMGSFQTSWLLAAGQWMADPNGDGNPSDAPTIVNCSWSFDTFTDTDFRPVLELWRSEGIWPVFAAGNSGPGAYTVAPPGSDPLAICVGATNSTDGLADSSSRGPAPTMAPFDEALKPDVVAPGVLVRSAIPGGGYTAATGTSMACAHVSGALALLRQALPGLSYDDAYRRLTATAVDYGAPGPDTAYGFGRINAWAAEQMAAGFVPPAISGLVCDSAAQPIADAVVDVSGARVLTGLDGRFTIPHVATGAYSLSADAPGFAPMTAYVSPGSLATVVLPHRPEWLLRDGCESGIGWVTGGAAGGTMRSSSANRTPGGSWSMEVFATGDTAERYYLSPRVPVAAAVGIKVNATYAWRGVGNADGRTTALTWEDQNGTVLATDYGTPFTPPTRGGAGDGVWRAVLQAYHAPAPVGARWVRLRLGAVFPSGDTTSAIWFDDATIDLVDAPLWGDVDGNGLVNVLDVATALRDAAGLSAGTLPLSRADVWPPGGDGSITLMDALTILRGIYGK